jgi:hypothetical protein
MDFIGQHTIWSFMITLYMAQKEFLNFFNLKFKREAIVGLSCILAWPVSLAQVLPTSSTAFSFQNLVFWNLLEFSAAEIT